MAIGLAPGSPPLLAGRVPKTFAITGSGAGASGMPDAGFEPATSCL
jgi:hypothetical protein